MIDQALQAIKAETLSLFLAKRLPNIKEKLDKSTDQVVENNQIRFEQKKALEMTLWRLTTFKDKGSFKGMIRSVSLENGKRRQSTF